MSNLIIALLVLILLGICLVGVLFFLRRKRQSRKKELLPTHKKTHRRLTITAAPYYGRPDSIHVIEEKRNLINNSSSPPQSPVPEIRITFPDEEDHAGRPMGGHVVVVRLGETGAIGMEPLSEDQLPPYQVADTERFQSLDLDRIGGLKEKL